MSQAHDAPLVFTGPPHRLEARAPFLVSRAVSPPPAVEVAGKNYVLQFQSHEDDGTTSMFFGLPPATPPGTLKATVHIAHDAYPASARVLESPRIVLEPPALTLSGAPGSKIVASVRATNAGNVPVPLERVASFSMRRAGALGRSVSKAFKETRGDFVSRVIALGEELKTEPAGEAAAALEADFTTLEPGETRTVEIRVEVPGDLDAAATWRGNLSLLGANIPTTLNASQAP